MNVSLFIPCFVDLCHPAAGISAARVLEHLGHSVDYAEELTCCGQPAFNSGCWGEARDVAQRVVRRLSEAEAIVVVSGSCGAMLKVYYPELFAGTELEAEAKQVAQSTYEFSDFLVSRLGVTDVGARFSGRATLHDGCHGLRELGVQQQPRTLLKSVEGLELVEMEGTEICCGFGGTFAAKMPAISTAMGERKCHEATATEAEYLVSNDSSCLLHLRGLLDRQGSPLKTLHLAEVLASV